MAGSRVLALFSLGSACTAFPRARRAPRRARASRRTPHAGRWQWLLCGVLDRRSRGAVALVHSAGVATTGLYYRD